MQKKLPTQLENIPVGSAKPNVFKHCLKSLLPAISRVSLVKTIKVFKLISIIIFIHQTSMLFLLLNSPKILGLYSQSFIFGLF